MSEDVQKYHRMAEENANHIKTINDEMGDLRDVYEKLLVCVTRNATDLSWLKKAFWAVFSVSVATFVGIMVSLLK